MNLLSSLYQRSPYGSDTVTLMATKRGSHIIDDVESRPVSKRKLPKALAKRSHFEYDRLPEQAIRLLRLLPCQDDSDLRCALSVHPRNDWAGSIEYAAISYTWGPPSPTKIIYINDRALEVRHNCWAALLQAWRQRWALRCWIDAVCVNQDDLVEKAQQVSMMGDIYSYAQLTAASIASDQEAAQLLHEIAVSPSLSELYLRASPTSRPDLLSKYQERLHKLAGLSYWSRIWIVQEVLLAREVQLLSGATILPWDDLYHKWIESGIHPIPEAKSSAVLQALLLERARVDFAVEADRSYTTSSDVLADSIVKFGKGQSSDPHDKIYGLLSLRDRPRDGVKLEKALQIDYRSSVFAMVVRFADGLSGSVDMFTAEQATQQLVEEIGTRFEAAEVDRFLQQRTIHGDNISNHLPPRPLFPSLRDHGLSFDVGHIRCASKTEWRASSLLHATTVDGAGFECVPLEAFSPKACIANVVVCTLASAFGHQVMLLCRPRQDPPPQDEGNANHWAHTIFDIVGQAILVAPSTIVLEEYPGKCPLHKRRCCPMASRSTRASLVLHQRDFLALALQKRHGGSHNGIPFTVPSTCSYIEMTARTRFSWATEAAA